MTAINLTIKKHWIVYVKPGLLILLALFFIYISFGIQRKWLATILLVFGIITAVSRIMKVLYLSSVTWTFNGGELVVTQGVLPWNKGLIQIPIFDIYDSAVSNSFWGHYFHFGHIAIRRTEGVTSHISETYLNGAVDFSATVNHFVQEYKKSQKVNLNSDITHDLERLSYLKNIGSLTDDEFENLKRKLLNN